MIDLAIGCACVLTLIFGGAYVERLTRPKCKHQWAVLAKTHFPDTPEKHEHTNVLLACDECGETEEHTLLGAETTNDP